MPMLWFSFIFFLGIGLICGVRAVQQAHTLRRLRREGVAGEAVITSRTVTGSPRGGYSFRLKYRYEYQRQSYEREERVRAKLYRAWTTGSYIPVRYLPENPSLVAIEGNHTLFAFALTSLLLL